MSKEDKWAERRNEKEWIRTERSYSSAFSQLPEQKTDRRQGWIWDPGEACLRDLDPPMLAICSLASLKQLQCDTKRWQGCWSSRLARLHTYIQKWWWQLLISKVFIEEVTDSITKRVFQNGRDLILQQRPRRSKRIKRIVWPHSVIKWWCGREPCFNQHSSTDTEPLEYIH